jgi:hypothetical protein
VLYGANVRNLRAGNYAIITDFNPRVDSIQLVSTDFGDIFPEGNTVNYVLDQSPMGLPRGTGIFIDTDSNGTGDLLVAVISNNTDLNLNSSYFSFI